MQSIPTGDKGMSIGFVYMANRMNHLIRDNFRPPVHIVYRVIYNYLCRNINVSRISIFSHKFDKSKSAGIY